MLEGGEKGRVFRDFDGVLFIYGKGLDSFLRMMFQEFLGHVRHGRQVELPSWVIF
jgi:hypothetical protein